MLMIPQTFAHKAINFYFNLTVPADLPPEIEVMNPYTEAPVRELVRQFYEKFFNDSQPRTLVIGINPGRFGGGVTGISFTDPVALREHCGIKNNMGTITELSSRFVYAFINRFGGAEKFYSQFFLTSVYPLAITRHGKNYNYYDENPLFLFLKPAMIASLRQQLEFGACRDSAICFGQKNYQYLAKLNKEQEFFKEIRVVDHPRYILQYKKKELENYLDEYMRVFGGINS